MGGVVCDIVNVFSVQAFREASAGGAIAVGATAVGAESGGAEAVGRRYRPEERGGQAAISSARLTIHPSIHPSNHASRCSKRRRLRVQGAPVQLPAR